jgi:AcrR family transcriptional regulator
MPRKSLDQLPLRQRKFAETKLGLLDAALEAIRTRPLDEVPVRVLCAAVSISEATFFNYFPKKSGLLSYYVQLWSIEMTWRAGQFADAAVGGGGALAAIEDIFARTATAFAENPAPMGEIIAGQARLLAPPAFVKSGIAERLKTHAGLDRIETAKGEGLGELLPPLVDRAIQAGELPVGTDQAATVVALASIFLGAPVVLRAGSPKALAPAYANQLQLLWAGLGAAPKGSRR